MAKRTYYMKVSIITINYNNHEGLQKTIDSILAQTWRDFEWIVIDGGSTDGSKALLEQQQDHFAYWCSEPDKGVYNAINKGIAQAQGDYISCMNSGDTFYAPDTLQKVFSEEREADILYGDWLQVFDDHELLVDFPAPVELYSFYLRNICHQAMFVRTSFLKKKGFDESFRIKADYSRWIEAALDGLFFEHIPVTVCRYDMGGLSSNNPDISIRERQQLESKTIPKPVLLSMERLHYYEQDKTVQRVKRLMGKGSRIALITQKSVALLAKIFGCF